VAYVLVTTPDPLAIREVLYFAERLRQLRMRRDAFVVNRVNPRGGDLPSEAEIVEAVRARGLQLGDDAPARLRKAAEDEGQLGRQDSLHLIALDGALDDEPEGVGTLRVDVPAFAYDIHDLERLVQIADVLAPMP
jgi:anion-transporting  ArsA/GET3 family ATPase